VKAFKIGTVLLLMGAVALPAMADGPREGPWGSEIYYENARVLSVAPQNELVNNPRQECSTEYIRESYNYGGRDIGGAIIGGIAGGLLGSHIGKGNGRVASAAVGAATGAIVGDRIDNSGRNAYSTRPVERCATVDNWQTVNHGYLVTYLYNGRTYTTTMPNDPGNTVSVRVSVAPGYRYNVVSYVPGYLQRDNGWHRGWGKHGRDRDHDHDHWDD
jgi:uncharacterized protein YcfJ